jgi:DNA modification methylase
VNALPKPYYKDDFVTIYHGDCREIVPLLGRFDLLLTDPPYGIGFAARPTDYQRASGMKPSTWDDSAPDVLPLLKSADAQCIWGGNYFGLPVSRGWLAWCKPDAPPSMGNLELAWTSEDRNSKHFFWSIAATNGERLGHPTQKPLALIGWCLSLWLDAQTVLDPFAGSGTTGRAAKDLGRKCTLIEREERYCEIAAKRMRQEVLLPVAAVAPFKERELFETPAEPLAQLDKHATRANIPST